MINIVIKGKSGSLYKSFNLNDLTEQEAITMGVHFSWLEVMARNASKLALESKKTKKDEWLKTSFAGYGICPKCKKQTVSHTAFNRDKTKVISSKSCIYCDFVNAKREKAL